METFQLYYMKQAFAPVEKRFTNLRAEATRLRYLWSDKERPTRRRTDQEIRNLFTEASECVQQNTRLLYASELIKKILKHDPRSSVVHALRGDLYKILGKCTHAIRSYEVARLMDKVMANRVTRYSEEGVHYVSSLVECYKARGDAYYEKRLFIEASSDYERALVLKPTGPTTIDIEDKLLEAMKILDKYDAYYSYWLDFMRTSSPMRLSDLLTSHAKYKFFLRDIRTAREFLIEALELNESNVKARKLLQEMHELGRTMSVHAIIWCLYRCYDKALYTMEKVRDCDPENLEYILVKAMIFRLSGRLNEAISCLGQMKEVLDKRMVSSSHILDTSVPLLSMQEIREQIKKQFLLIKYSSAMQAKVKETNTCCLKN